MPKTVRCWCNQWCKCWLHNGSNYAPDFEIAAIYNGIIRFKTNDTERMRIDTSGRLFMGVTQHYRRRKFQLMPLMVSRQTVELQLLYLEEQIIFNNPNGDVGSIDTSGTSHLHRMITLAKRPATT